MGKCQMGQTNCRVPDLNLKMEEKEPEKEIIDLRGTACPLNFAKLIVRIEDIQKNNKKSVENKIILEALVDDAYCGNVVRNVKNYNYKIVYAHQEDGYFKIGIEI